MYMLYSRCSPSHPSAILTKITQNDREHFFIKLKQAVGSSHICLWSDLAGMRSDGFTGAVGLWEIAVIGFRLWLCSWGVRRKPPNTSNLADLPATLLIQHTWFTTLLTLYEWLKNLVKAEWLQTRIKMFWILFQSLLNFVLYSCECICLSCLKTLEHFI